MTVLDNSNIVESYPGLCSPLTCSFAEQVYRLIFRRLATRLIDDPLPPEIDHTVDSMAVAYQGRMYYRIDNWYHLLQILPFRRRLLAIWQRSLGVTNSEVPPPLTAVSFFQRLRVLRRFAFTWRQTPALMRRLDDEFAAVQARFIAGFDLASPDLATLHELYDQVRDGVLNNWDVTLVNDLRAFVYTALAQRLGCAITGTDVVSMKPVWALDDLRSQPGLRHELSPLTTADEVDRYLTTGTPLARALHDYIDAYGDRSPGELKLETKTYRTHPLSLVHMLLDGPTDDTPTPWLPQHAPDVAITSEGRLKRAITHRALEAIRHRESSRLNRSRIFGMVRDLVRAAGDLMTAAGTLDSPDDVFYLTINEVFSPPNDARALVTERRQTWAGYALQDPPNRITLDDNFPARPDKPGSTPSAPDGRPLTPNHAVAATRKAHRGTQGRTSEVSARPSAAARPPRDTPALRGTPCSAGRADGGVVIVTDPADAGDVAGKIIVAVSTDPGWVFLMARAAGIITERGSLLSHTAIVSRELGVPAVVGVANATTLLRDGDTVRLDATSGRIEVTHHA